MVSDLIFQSLSESSFSINCSKILVLRWGILMTSISYYGSLSIFFFFVGCKWILIFFANSINYKVFSLSKLVSISGAYSFFTKELTVWIIYTLLVKKLFGRGYGDGVDAQTIVSWNHPYAYNYSHKWYTWVQSLKDFGKNE